MSERPSAARASAKGTTAEDAAAKPPPDLGTPTTFVLLRHGETALTPERRFSGSGGGDPSLSPAGRAQAARTARFLAGLHGTPEGVEAVVSSPLARCRETAGTVADALGLSVTVEDGLRETDFGQWEGLSFAEARAFDPGAFDAWLADPAAPPPGGESFTQVRHRVTGAADRLRARHTGRSVLLVSHVTPVKTLLRLALGAPHEAVFRMDLAPASLSALARYADGNASVRYVNSTGHLRTGD